MTAPSAATSTHRGGHPSHNEDRALVGDAWWAVADGMGGHHGGEVASATAVDAVAAVLGDRLGGSAPAVPEVVGALRDAVAAAGRALRERAATDEQLASMGTTLVAAALADDHGPVLVVANVGDSRAYLLTAPQQVVPLTRDDNVAEQLRALGLIEDHEVATHPGQYQLTKALTAYDEQTPEPTITRAPASGRLLLCSDGLTGELSEATVAGLMGRGSVQECADALVAAAVRAPARDNVTVVVADLSASAPAGPDAGPDAGSTTTRVDEPVAGPVADLD